MNITKVKKFTMCAALLCLVLAQALVVDAKPSNKWRIKFNHIARSTGDIVFLVQPVEGEAIEVTAHIEEGMSENTIAKVVRDAFRAQMPEGFLKKVKTDDGEKVLLKKGRGTPNFDLKLISSTVDSVKIKLHRE